jgi:anti-sigma B factor antagonist
MRPPGETISSILFEAVVPPPAYGIPSWERSVEALSLSAEPRDGKMIVTVRGDLDIVMSQQFDDCLTQARREHNWIILDLSAVDFMDTSALAVIVGHWKKLVAAGGTLALAGARYRYTKALWITGLADRLPLYDTVDLALSASGGRPCLTARAADSGV